MEMRYHAFISYRHKPLDMAVAERLHRLLERYRPPRALAGDRKGPTRVFRDREELPVSSDLSADICDALDHSEYLIVICTPDTPDSKWVQREIDYFLKSHEYTRVLAVLAAGEPEEAFPWQLTHPFPEDQERETEPLAADVRAGDTRKSLAKLRQEFLRLYAGMLNVSYDSLVQREHKRRQRRLAAVIAATLAVAGVLLYENLQIAAQKDKLEVANQTLEEQRMALEDANQTLETQKEALEDANQTLEEQKLDLQRNESRLLAESAREALESGNYVKALSEAAAALPQDEEDTRPYCAPAEAVLMDVLDKFRYLDVKRYIQTTEIRQETEIAYFCASSDGLRVYTIDRYGSAHCFDLYTGEEIWRSDLPFATQSEESISFVLSEQNGLLYVAAKLSKPDRYNNCVGILALDISTGETKWAFDSLQIYEGELCIAPDESRLALMARTGIFSESDYSCFILDPQTGECVQHWWGGDSEDKNSTDLSFNKTNVIAFDAEDPTRIVSWYDEKDGETKFRYFYSIDLEAEQIIPLYSCQIEDKTVNVLALQCRDGKLYVVSDSGNERCAAELLCIDIDTQALMWRAETPEAADEEHWTLASCHALLDADYGRLLVGCSKHLYAYDTASGELLGENAYELSDNVSCLYPAGDGLYDVLLEDGRGYIMRLKDDSLWYPISLEFFSKSTKSSKCLITGGGILNGVLTEDSVDCWGGSGAILYVPDIVNTAGHRLCFTRWYADDIGTKSQIIQEKETFLMAVAPDSNAWVEGDSVTYAEQAYELGQTIYRLITLDTRTLEKKVLTFPLNRSLRESGSFGSTLGRLLVTADGDGVMIDTGDGDLLYYDAASNATEALYGEVIDTVDHQDPMYYFMASNVEEWLYGQMEAERPSTNRQKRDHQGMWYAAGTYILDARQSETGAALGAVCEDGRLRLWQDGDALPDAELPEGVIWQRAINDTSYRVLVTGENGYVLLSDFQADEAANTLKGFACYRPKTGEWRTIADEVGGRADRVLAMAHSSPSFAVVDDDRRIRLYDIETGECVACLELPVISSSIRAIGFSQDDQYLFAVTEARDDQIFVYRLQSGELVYNSLSDFEDPITLTMDVENQRMYILCGAWPKSYGYCVDMRSWIQLDEMDNDPQAVVPETGSLLFFHGGDLCLQHIPTTQELVAEAKQMMEDMSVPQG